MEIRNPGLHWSFQGVVAEILQGDMLVWKFAIVERNILLIVGVEIVGSRVM